VIKHGARSSLLGSLITLLGTNWLTLSATSSLHSQLSLSSTLSVLIIKINHVVSQCWQNSIGHIEGLWRAAAELGNKTKHAVKWGWNHLGFRTTTFVEYNGDCGRLQGEAFGRGKKSEVEHHHEPSA